MKISFLASHGGSSAKAIIKAMNDGEVNAQPGVIITNNRDSAIYQWCKENDFPVFHISSVTHSGAGAEDAAIRDTLLQSNTDVVVCSGYMKKIGPDTLNAFNGKILNIHPALLPNHGGKGLYGDKVHESVLDAGEIESGATVHIVDAEYDRGPILGRSRVRVDASDTVATLRANVQATEPGLYIECLSRFLKTIPDSES